MTSHHSKSKQLKTKSDPNKQEKPVGRKLKTDQGTMALGSHNTDLINIKTRGSQEEVEIEKGKAS